MKRKIFNVASLLPTFLQHFMIKYFASLSYCFIVDLILQNNLKAANLTRIVLPMLEKPALEVKPKQKPKVEASTKKPKAETSTIQKKPKFSPPPPPPLKHTPTEPNFLPRGGRDE